MMMFLCLQLAISSTVLVYSSTTDSIFRTKLDEHNKLAYYSVLDYSSTTSSSSQWTFVNEKDGVTVHKKFLQDSPVYLHLSGNKLKSDKALCYKYMHLILSV
jgi:hypothetical protein